ncbi:MAG: hypothetical protein JSS42_00745 [Proteobacteria bacterium]|nr:hypothetical protein [Pseudomonadota bacterium]
MISNPTALNARQVGAGNDSDGKAPRWFLPVSDQGDEALGGKQLVARRQGDAVREFVEACRAESLCLDPYCSPWDRNLPA